jgi:8-oxo-dGTP diphosphatase
MALYLVRHAVAVSRSSWKGDYEDPARPLTPKGQRQSKALVRLLGAADVRRIYTSPTVRCRDTVAPLADARGVEIRETKVLAEGHGGAKGRELMDELAGKRGDSVLCTHGDLVPDILRRLARDGMTMESDLQYAKGSTWEIDVEDGRITAGRYHPPAE